MERWVLLRKGADYQAIGKKFHIAPRIACLIRNREVIGDEAIDQYLNGTIADLHDGMLMKGMDQAVDILMEKIREGARIRVIGDYDIDGVNATYILLEALEGLRGEVDMDIPDRITDGYGLNRNLIDRAFDDGIDTIITCDNGIAANEEVDYAKKLGMTVIVTDHHEVQEQMPNADAILDPKRDDETYPFRGLCGAGVAFKLICALYDAQQVPAEAKDELLEYAGIATVADVMELQGENRILVKYGLKALSHTKNIGLRALLKVQELEDKQITAGHIGFILGPCFNAAGRIATVAESFSLLMEEDEEKALEKAERLKEINESRKQMTEDGAEEAYLKLEEKEAKNKLPKVLIVLLPDTHESLVGIIAGRVKERYNRPTIVFTETEDGLVKGSGRSIEVYDMFHELMACKDLMERFGGHKMAAGMTLHEKDLPELEKRLNENCVLTEEDFRPVVRIDAPMPIGYITETLLSEIEQMEPFGVGNPKPIFAEQHFRILSGRKFGVEGTVLKLQVQNDVGNRIGAVCFRRTEEFEQFVIAEWGEAELKRMYEGRENLLDIAFTYYPSVNEYNGRRELQIQIAGWCRIPR